MSSVSRASVLAPGGNRGSRPRSIGCVESPTSLGFARAVVAVRGFAVAIAAASVGVAGMVRSSGFVTSPKSASSSSLDGSVATGAFAVILGSGLAFALGVAG